MQMVAFFLSSLFMCSSVFAGSVTSLSLESLSSALNQRMLIMKQVAGYKAQRHLPVEDVIREQKVLADMQNNARQAGLDPHSVAPFVHALISAGKAIQYRYLADWQATPDQHTAASDLSDTRQQILQLDSQMMTAISQRLMAGGFSDTDMTWLAAQITAPGLSDADKNNLLVSLSLIRRSL